MNTALGSGPGGSACWGMVKGFLALLGPDLPAPLKPQHGGYEELCGLLLPSTPALSQASMVLLPSLTPWREVNPDTLLHSMFTCPTHCPSSFRSRNSMS